MLGVAPPQPVMVLPMASLRVLAEQYDEGMELPTFLRLTMRHIEGEGGEPVLGDSMVKDDAVSDLFVSLGELGDAVRAIFTSLFRAFSTMDGDTVEYPELLIMGLSDLTPPSLEKCKFIVDSFSAHAVEGLDFAELAEVIYSMLLVRRACLPAKLSSTLREKQVNRMAQTIASTALAKRTRIDADALLALIRGANITRALDAATRALDIKPWINAMRKLFNVRAGDIAGMIDAIAAASDKDGRIQRARFVEVSAATVRLPLASDATATLAAAQRIERLEEIFAMYVDEGVGPESCADVDLLSAGMTRLACPGAGHATVDAVLRLYGQAEEGAAVSMHELSDFLRATRTFEEALREPGQRIALELINAGADAEAQRVLEIIDTDADGVMNYHEFVQWFVDGIIELDGHISTYDLFAGRARPSDAMKLKAEFRAAADAGDADAHVAEEEEEKTERGEEEAAEATLSEAPTEGLASPCTTSSLLPTGERKTALTSGPRNRRMSSAHSEWKERMRAGPENVGAGEWTAVVAPGGRTYWYHTVTKECVAWYHHVHTLCPPPSRARSLLNQTPPLPLCTCRTTWVDPAASASPVRLCYVPLHFVRILLTM